MQQVLSYLRDKSLQELATDPLYQWIGNNNRDTLCRQFDVVIPILNFILTFPNYNQQYLTYTTNHHLDDYTDSLINIINQHAAEDAQHIYFFLQDILKLNLATIWGLNYPSHWLWVIWSCPQLDAARGNASNRIRSLLAPEHLHKLAYRYIHIEQIEQDGHYLFSSFNKIATQLVQREKIQAIYFGKYHLEMEQAHVGNGAFAQIRLSPTDREKVIEIVNYKHMLSKEMNTMMLHFAETNSSTQTTCHPLIDEQHRAIHRAKEKMQHAYPFPDLVWSISPKPGLCDNELYEAWQLHHDRFLQHPLSHIMKNTPIEDSERVLRIIMLFFANRMLSLRTLNLYDLSLSPAGQNETETVFKKLRQMFATHSTLYFHDWHELNMDEQLKEESPYFLKLLFTDTSVQASDLEAIFEFRREALSSAYCAPLKLWCYLSINFMATAFTLGTKVLAEQYQYQYPHRSPLVYLGGQLHLLYEEVDTDWNNPHRINHLYQMPVSSKNKAEILAMMQRMCDHGIRHWDNLARLLSNYPTLTLTNLFTLMHNKIGELQ